MALIALVWRRSFWTRIGRLFRRLILPWKQEPAAAGEAPVTIPYGIAIAAGCLGALWLRGL